MLIHTGGPPAVVGPGEAQEGRVLVVVGPGEVQEGRVFGVFSVQEGSGDKKAVISPSLDQGKYKKAAAVISEFFDSRRVW